MFREKPVVEVECTFEIGTFGCFSLFGQNIGFDKKWRGSNDGWHHCASKYGKSGKVQRPSIELQQSKDANGSLNLWKPGL